MVSLPEFSRWSFKIICLSGEIVENFSQVEPLRSIDFKKTSCVYAIDNVMPGMINKISSMSFRVPVK